ncbi:hypothetical protein, partial [Candidatus Thiosymbion oneisti]|uniref:hypothetical protein n=1 Tax=Candidatus Thiosymbion oneisti TaxID=589554 RepID=UPI001A9C90AA
YTPSVHAHAGRTSKAAAGWCHLADPLLMLGAVGSGKHWGKVAAACLGADRHSKTSGGTLP